MCARPLHGRAAIGAEPSSPLTALANAGSCGAVNSIGPNHQRPVNLPDARKLTCQDSKRGLKRRVVALMHPHRVSDPADRMPIGPWRTRLIRFRSNQQRRDPAGCAAERPAPGFGTGDRLGERIAHSFLAQQPLRNR